MIVLFYNVNVIIFLKHYKNIFFFITYKAARYSVYFNIIFLIHISEECHNHYNGFYDFSSYFSILFYFKTFSKVYTFVNTK